MAIYLQLEEAKILKAEGFGNINFAGPYLVQLEDYGRITVHCKRVFGGYQEIYALECGRTELYVGSVGITTGGGWSGGGFGAKGMVEGVLAATLLNALTTRNREYAVLTLVHKNSEHGGKKLMAFGFRYLLEDTLRGRLGQAIPVWMEAVVAFNEERLQNLTDKEQAAQYFDIVTSLQKRGMLNDEQAERLFVLLKKIIPEAFTAPVSPAKRADRIEQLKMLSEMRDSKALTEDEFQAEKRRLLSGS
jgi:hypothetical protein